MTIIILKFIKLACICLINCYLQYMIGSSVVFPFSKKVFLFGSKLAWRRKTVQMAWKKWTHFSKILMFKKQYFFVGRSCNNIFKWFLHLLEKCIVGYASFINEYNSLIESDNGFRILFTDFFFKLWNAGNGVTRTSWGKKWQWNAHKLHYPVGFLLKLKRKRKRFKGNYVNHSVEISINNPLYSRMIHRLNVFWMIDNS